MHFAKHVGFADTAGNQLGDLRAEVEDQDLGMRHAKRNALSVGRFIGSQHELHAGDQGGKC